MFDHRVDWATFTDGCKRKLGWLCAKSSKSLLLLGELSILTKNTFHLAAMGEHRHTVFFPKVILFRVSRG